jgi:ubiquitin carboxyl-terminal hydrolase 4/11/15
MSGGHYTAYGLNYKTHLWYEFDDRTVSRVSDISDLITSAAYVLFYRKRI